MRLSRQRSQQAIMSSFLSPPRNFRWLQLYMVNLFVGLRPGSRCNHCQPWDPAWPQERWNPCHMECVQTGHNHSVTMNCFGSASYLLLFFHLFVLPKCPLFVDPLTLYNIPPIRNFFWQGGALPRYICIKIYWKSNYVIMALCLTLAYWSSWF